MPRVEFVPSGKTVVVDETVLLSDAARRAGVFITLPCGGKGTCKRCLVAVLEGAVVQYEPPPEGSLHNVVLACKTAVGLKDCRIEIRECDYAQDDTDDTPIEETIVLDTDEISPFVQLYSVVVPFPKVDDGLSDLDRATREIANFIGVSNIEWGLDAMRKLPEALRSEKGAISVLTYHDKNTVRINTVRPRNLLHKSFGVAIDLGTTTVSVMIIDQESGTVLGGATGYNEQIACGEDIISRINYARNRERLEELQNKAARTINRLIQRSAKKIGISCDDIFAAVISGNTTMMHLLLGITPEYLRLDPYTPAFFSPGILRAKDVGLNINPAAAIIVSPAVGSYVGGDITAGVLCADFHQRDEVALFIDVGTNGEIVLGNKEFLFTCACSAGPAFEGGGISCGMRAREGAIAAVAFDQELRKLTFSIIGGGRPKGICGSGIIDLLSALLQSGLMDRSGKLIRETNNEAILVEGRKARLRLASGDESATGKELCVSEQDIENVLRAKAAVFAAVATLLKYAGMGFSEIARVYIAGGFGRVLNIENAIAIGLFPELPLEKFVYLGNASLKGSVKLLLSEKMRELQSAIASRMTYVNLSSQSDYAGEYTAALFFPHTDESLFPTAIQKRR